MELAEQLHQERPITVVMVTQYLSVAQRTERIMRVQDGAIVSDRAGTPPGERAQ